MMRNGPVGSCAIRRGDANLLGLPPIKSWSAMSFHFNIPNENNCFTILSPATGRSQCSVVTLSPLFAPQLSSGRLLRFIHLTNRASCVVGMQSKHSNPHEIILTNMLLICVPSCVYLSPDSARHNRHILLHCFLLLHFSMSRCYLRVTRILN